MSEPNKAVFLSYASQDAEAARRICEALRAGGIEVWFDQRELRGGDAWAQQIRKQIHDCALFIAVISATTQGREEGYFRREWNLAVDRTHDRSERRAFLVPVAIDDTGDAEADVPDAFRAVQWTRLPAGETPPAFVARISQLLSPSPSHAPAQGRPSSAHLPAPSASALRGPRVVPLLIAAFALLGVGYFALEKFGLSKHSAASMPGGSTQSAIPEKSIAVLPFVDMSEKHDQEYFSDGLSEELIDHLAHIADLKVIARTSSFAFKGKNEDMRSIATKLGVSNLLEGSVRKAGDTLRVTAQLIRASTGVHLWSETYDRDMKDVFKVQDEIAGAVVTELKLKLLPTAQTASARTSNPDAHNAYLLGRQFFDRGGLDNWQRAIDAYSKAIALDPSYAAAYAELAIATDFHADQIGDSLGLKRAEAAADKAVALAPEQADGYAARGLLRAGHAWDWAGAQADFEKAVALDPNNSTVLRRYGILLSSVGRLPEAIGVTRKSTDLDPLSARAWSELGDVLTYSQKYPAAHEAYRRALEIHPEDPFVLYGVGTLQLLDGQVKEALATFRKSTGVEAFRLEGISIAEHTLDHVKESQRALDELIAKDGANSAYQIAEVFAWRGERDKALEWLERAYKQKDGGLTSIKTDPLLKSLHADPRFKALLRKLKLPETQTPTTS